MVLSFVESSFSKFREIKRMIDISRSFSRRTRRMVHVGVAPALYLRTAVN
jgi:hypothetical protein